VADETLSAAKAARRRLNRKLEMEMEMEIGRVSTTRI
jgi:hypothetical protein